MHPRPFGVLALLGVLALACDKPPLAPAPPPAPVAPVLPATASSRPPELPETPEPSRPLSPPPSGPSAAPSASGFERRCGWVDNPTPANWWLVDRDGTWEIGIQGGHQAEGDLPDFGGAWVETNGHHGYGCACVDVRVDRSSHQVLVVRGAKALPLARCKGDKALPPHP
jgi:hypothetical protein